MIGAERIIFRLRPHDARMASDHDDASDPLDLQTLKVAGIVLACILGAAAVIALAGAM